VLLEYGTATIAFTAVKRPRFCKDMLPRLPFPPTIWLTARCANGHFAMPNGPNGNAERAIRPHETARIAWQNVTMANSSTIL
jgi:hypothetical protein